MKYVDAHIHLSDPECSLKLDEIIDDAKRSNVVALVSNSMDLPTSLARAETVKLILHPRWQDGEIVAVGEVGLDYQYSKTKELQDLQHKVFHEMLHAAEKSPLPVIIHSRRTTPEIAKLLDSSRLKRVLLHWVSRL